MAAHGGADIVAYVHTYVPQPCCSIRGQSRTGCNLKFRRWIFQRLKLSLRTKMKLKPRAPAVPTPNLTTHQYDEKDEDGAGLFHARILLAEADPRSAKRIKEMLEEAGYMVTVEGDGKQVIFFITANTQRGWRA